MKNFSLLSFLLLATTATTPVFAWTAAFTTPVAGTVCDAGKTCPIKWFIINGTNGGNVANVTAATDGTDSTNGTDSTDGPTAFGTPGGTNAPNITDIYLFSGLNASLVRGAKLTPNGVDPEAGTFDWLVPTTLKGGLDYTVGMEDTIDKTYHYSHYFTIRGNATTTTSALPTSTSTKPTSAVPRPTSTPVQDISSGAPLNDMSLLVLLPFVIFATAYV